MQNKGVNYRFRTNLSDLPEAPENRPKIDEKTEEKNDFFDRQGRQEAKWLGSFER